MRSIVSLSGLIQKRGPLFQMSEKSLNNVVPYDASLVKLASAFRSNHPYLDSFLNDGLALNPSYGKTYVWLTQERSAIIGYYNITTGYVEQDNCSIPERMGGSIHVINCFAPDEKFHGITVGRRSDGQPIRLSDMLLQECIHRIEQIRENNVGFAFITLCATEDGKHLYERQGFFELETDMSFHTNEKDMKNTFMYYPLEYE